MRPLKLNQPSNCVCVIVGRRALRYSADSEPAKGHALLVRGTTETAHSQERRETVPYAVER